MVTRQKGEEVLHLMTLCVVEIMLRQVQMNEVQVEQR
jgi:hypothetical protein